MNKLPRMIGADEVAEALCVSHQYAYTIINKLNKERREMGFETRAGKISEAYFIERYFEKSED